MSGTVSVPTCVTGSVKALENMGTCMDGATHLVNIWKEEGRGAMRLKARNERVKAQLDAYTDAKILVTACGNLVEGAECTHLDVYAVGQAHNFSRIMQPMWDGDLPWPDVLRNLSQTLTATSHQSSKTPAFNLSGHAIRVGKSIEVTVAATLPNSCYEARVADFYPGGGRVYVVDPGAAQVFVEITLKSGSDRCLMRTFPWARTLAIPDQQHKNVEIFLNNSEALEVAVVEKDEFIVISPTGSEMLYGCSIVPAESMVLGIYSKRFGPASYEGCRTWISQNCGWD